MNKKVLHTLYRRVAYYGGDRRSKASVNGLQELYKNLAQAEMILSVGGGPNRISRGININIALLPEVDLVGDAHRLPLKPNAFGGIFCEAVIEHLESPSVAVNEMLRVLREGGMVYSVTPFLQAFHAHPNHFCNFTLTGHVLLFKRAGFEIIQHGCCVGPVYALCDLIRYVLRTFVRPVWLSDCIGYAWWLLSWPLRFLDTVLANSPRADSFCSTTFVLARKPCTSTRLVT